MLFSFRFGFLSLVLPPSLFFFFFFLLCYHLYHNQREIFSTSRTYHTTLRSRPSVLPTPTPGSREKETCAKLVCVLCMYVLCCVCSCVCISLHRNGFMAVRKFPTAPPLSRPFSPKPPSHMTTYLLYPSPFYVSITLHHHISLIFYTTYALYQ